jgi:hypothetical protein
LRVVPLLVAVQVAPSSVVTRVVPALPTATQVVPDQQVTPFNCWVEPLVCGDQVTPPSGEPMITAAPAVTAPTASQVEAMQDTPVRFTAVPLVRGSQVWPPSDVVTTVPPLPTATQ